MVGLRFRVFPRKALGKNQRARKKKSAARHTQRPAPVLRAGQSVHAAQDENGDLRALGYFISPIDVIPDFIPVVGFTDDIGVLAAAVVMAASYIDAEARAKADTKLAGWFGEGTC